MHKWRDRYQEIPATRRAAIEAEVAAILDELPLDELRRARELSQVDLAELLGTKQSSISKLEQQTDMYLSTLKRYVEAMGGELVIAARFPAAAIRSDRLDEVGGNRGMVKSRVVKEERTVPKSTGNTGKTWKPGEVAQLKKLAQGNTPTRVIGLKLGRTAQAVQAKANRESISLKPTNQSPYNRQKKR